MAVLNKEISANKEVAAVLKEVNRFASKIMRPAGVEIDARNDPADAFKQGSAIFDVFRACRKLDLHLPWIPEDLGGMGETDPMAEVFVAESMGGGDLGLAVSLASSNAVFQLAAQIAAAPVKKLIKEYCEDYECTMIGCLPSPEDDNAVTATPAGSGYELNGQVQKAVNASIGTHAALFVTIDDEEHSEAFAIVPLNRAGVTRTPPQAKTAQRACDQAGLEFENVKLAKSFLLQLDPEAMQAMKRTFRDRERRFLSAAYAGLALAAWEEARKYAKGRIQGGCPIYFHKNIQLQFFNMLKSTEAARSLSLRLARSGTDGGKNTTILTTAALCLATETASHVASEAIQILGGYGLAKEFPVEKMFRDARMGMVAHGVNEDMGLKAMELL